MQILFSERKIYFLKITTERKFFQTKITTERKILQKIVRFSDTQIFRFEPPQCVPTTEY